LDSNILISYIISKRDNTIVKKVVIKSITDDRLMLTDVICDECRKYAGKKGATVTEDDISNKLIEICPGIINISPVPSEEELLKKYNIRDKSDLKILYSVEMTDSVILVTLDDDFTDVKNLRAKIMRPGEYLYEESKKEQM